MNKQHYSDGQRYALATSISLSGKNRTNISNRPTSFAKQATSILAAVILAGLLLVPAGLWAQYVTVGNATNLGGDCYRLTEVYQNNQAGAIWYVSKIDLSHDVHIEGSLNLGFLDGGGADGMGFVMQPVSNGIGVFGGGLGFQGISPCLAVEFDTWQNTEFNDPFVDHIALSKNGVLNHAAPENLQGPIGLPNLEDNVNHPFIIHWNAAAKNLQVTLDGILRINYSGDVVANIFNGDDKVFWGFTGATGAATNNHTVCITNTSFTEDPTLTWTNGGGNQLWTNGANWTGGTPPAPTSDVVFNAATPSDADIDADVTVKSLTTSLDYLGKVKLNAKTLAIQRLLAIKKATSFSKGTGKVRIIGPATIKSKAPLHKLEIETPDFEVVSIEEDLEVADDLVIKSKTGLTTPTGKQINVQGNVDIQKPMPPTPSNPLIRFWGAATQKLKSAGGGKIVVDKTGGEVTLDASSTVQEVTVRKGWFRIPSGKTLSTSTSKPISVECQGAMKGSGFIARLMRIRKCGKIAPGNSPGTLTLLDGLEIESEGIYEYETSATETDLIVVEGIVTIDGGYLEIISNGTPSGILWLIDNDGNDPVTGTFEGLPEGATVTIEGATYIISYVGGDGNDVVLIPDACPNDPNKTEEGACGCGVEDVPTTWYADTDEDGFGDPDNSLDGYTCIQPDGYVDNGDDACPDDPNKTEPGVCGCGVEDVPTTWYADTDGDGFGDPDNSLDGYTCIQPDGYVANDDDACPTDLNKTEPGACGCGVEDVPTTWYADTDEDGFGDPDNSLDGYTCIQPDGYVDNGDDACPDDPNKTEPGACGCGVEDVDSDCDGVADCNDVCPGGDDSGPCNAETFPGMNNVPTDWKCHSNNKKVYVCHNGNTICVNENAVQAHLNHGDFLGPCTSCNQGLIAPPSMGSNAMTDGLEMHLFPNPTSGRVTVELHSLDTETAQLTVFDRLGRVVLAQKIEEGTHQLVLDFSSEQFAVGDYYVKVVSSTTTLTEKVSIFR